jgi:hypothetical protein
MESERLDMENGAKQKHLVERVRKSWRPLTESDLLYTLPIESLRCSLML